MSREWVLNHIFIRIYQNAMEAKIAMYKMNTILSYFL